MSYMQTAQRSSRFLVILVLFFASLEGLQAQSSNVTSNDYRLNPTDGCFIKALKNRSYVDVPLSNFSNSKIHAVPHPRRPKYFAFKNAGVIHVIPKKCLVVWDTPDDEFDGLNDVEETDEFAKYERLNSAASERRVINRIELGEMNYFIEAGGGASLFENGKGSFDDKNLKQFGDIIIRDNPGLTFANLKDSKSVLKNKSASAISLKFGHRSDENSFWVYGFRRFSLQRDDSYIYSTDLGDEPYNFRVQDTISEISIGKRYTFNTQMSVRPIFDFSLLLASVSQQMVGINETIANLKLNGTLVGAAFDLGLELLFTRNLALKVSGGYSHYFSQQFRLQEKNVETSEKGYESLFRYSNASGGVSLAYYFK